MNKQNNPPAFPRPASEAHQHGMHEPQEGMTLRDYFAARAMVKLMGTEDIDVCCESAYRWADAMLKAREAE